MARQICRTVCMSVSKWLPLYRALKLNNYEKELRPQISSLLRTSNPSESHHLPTLTNYYKIAAEYDQIMKECYPGTVLGGQDLLKRVANVVGLQLPKTYKQENKA